METQKKEITINKSSVSRITNSILNAMALSFIILIIVQHFGVISREYNYHYYSGKIVSAKVTFRSPLVDEWNLFYPKMETYYYSENDDNFEIELDYSEKFFKIYTADLINNHKTKFLILSIVILALIYLISYLKNKYSIKLK
ncbi:hypothetical protein SAMN05421741_101109 [Paenimyroides ummariense]|uniref:Uncharacterized protein n=1 Tax=Paenimyroides ummariense TaxID=913024 RepID=A0A1I4W7M6_9FLAO|nr:hypothetical protein [Paenimyroides ummariense]SFN09668.1 hypothetical protein SAMN05421741_101109 [Paenimyroides ummariense]